MQPFTCSPCKLGFDDVSHFLQHKLIHENAALEMSKVEGDKVKHNSIESPYSSLSNNNVQDKTIVHENPFECNGILKTSVLKKKSDDVKLCKTELTCDMSEFRTDRKKHLKHHKNDHLGKVFNCNKCEYTTTNETFLRLHGNKFHMGKLKNDSTQIYKCNSCKFSTAARHRLTRHIKEVHVREKMHECHICHKSFTRKATLELHLKRHQNQFKNDSIETYKCDSCKFFTDVKNNLIRHIEEVHFVEKTHPCHVCLKSFKRKDTLELHLKKHPNQLKNNSIRIYKCNACKFCTTGNARLIRHIKEVHFGEKPYTCHFCHNSYKRKDILESHLKRHQNQNNESELVRKKVNKQNKITDHFVCNKAVEENEYTPVSETLVPTVEVEESDKKSFSCHFCKAVFRTDSSLQNHIKYHNTYYSKKKENRGENSDKSFESKSCNDKNSFAKHMSTDFRKKPYKCNWCDFRTRYRTTLSKHVQLHEKSNVSELKTEENKKTDPQESFECCVCKGILKSQSLLIKHMKKHFPDLTTELEDNSLNENEAIDLKNINTDNKASHVDHKPFRCDECGFRTTRLGILKKHKERLHSIKKVSTPGLEKVASDTELPYSCKICKSTFKSLHGLKLHMKFHPFLNDKDEILSELSVSENQYSCNICRRNYSNGANLIRHQRLHAGGQYNCNNRNFTNYLKSRPSKNQTKKCEITRNLVSKGRYRCDTCLNKYSSEHALAEHRLTHNGEKRFACDQCSYTSDYKGNINKHKSKYHLIKNGKLTSALKAVRGNKQKSGGGKNKRSCYRCDICWRYYNTEQILLKHKLVHANLKMYTCNKCSYKTNNSANFRRHQNNLHKDKSELTPKLENVEEIKHLEADGDDKVKSRDAKGKIKRTGYGCDVCHRYYSSKHSLLKHKIIHSNLKPFACDKCSYRSNDRGNLSKHKNKFHTDQFELIPKLENVEEINNLETGESNKVKSRDIKRKNKRTGYGCDVCHRYFNCKANLVRHKFIHSNLKPFACDKCSYRTNDRGNLKRHRINLHNQFEFTPKLESIEENKDLEADGSNKVKSRGRKRKNKGTDYVCDICHRYFSSKQNLLGHKIIHSNLKPFACDKCSFRTNDKSNLRRHRINFHDQFEFIPKLESVEENKDSGAVLGDQEGSSTGGLPSVEINDSKILFSSNLPIESSITDKNNSYARDHTEMNMQELDTAFKLSKNKTNNRKHQTNFCQICERNYSSQSSLERHLRRHTGENPYSCDQCSFRTYDSTILKNHKSRHPIEDTLISKPEKKSRKSLVDVSDLSSESLVEFDGIETDVENKSLPNFATDVENTEMNEQIICLSNIKRQLDYMPISGSKADVGNMNISNTDVENRASSSTFEEENICLPNVKREIEDMSISSSNTDVKNISMPMTSSTSDVEGVADLSSKLVEQNVSQPHFSRETKSMSTHMASLNSVVENVTVLGSKLNGQNVSQPPVSREIESMTILNSKVGMESMSTSMTSSNSDVEGVADLSSKLVEQNVYQAHVSREIESMTTLSSKVDMESMSTSMTSSNSDVENVTVVGSKLDGQNVSQPHVSREIENMTTLSSKADMESMSTPMTS